jgi:hypothetical protein
VFGQGHPFARSEAAIRHVCSIRRLVIGILFLVVGTPAI